MEVLELRIKFVVQWIIEKKQAIATLVTNHLPIYRAIKQFIQGYINHMGEIVGIVEKIMKDLHASRREGNNQTLYELFDLIRQKELVGVQEWTEKMAILQDKYNKGTAQNKQFQDIFKDIDAHIDYYQQLRAKLARALQKSSLKHQNIHYSPNTEKNSKQLMHAETQRTRNVFKTYGEYTDIHSRKTDLYAGLYDKEYAEKEQKKVSQPLSRENGKIKKSPHHNTSPAQYSPYKLVNPKYQLYQEPNHEPIHKHKVVINQITPVHAHSKQIGQLMSRNQKYREYKRQLYGDLDKEMEIQRVKPKYTAEKYLNETPPKTLNKEYSTFYTDRYHSNQDRDGRSDGLKYQYWSDNKNQQPVGRNNEEDQSNNRKGNKKYQYLFDDDGDMQREIVKAKSPKTEIFNQRLPKNKEAEWQKYRQPVLARNTQDSLQQDRLGPELQVQMPTIFNTGPSNIEELLSSSLMSSKKWVQYEDNFSVGSQSPQRSEQDSLDDPSEKIRQTGKFKQIHYTDEDDHEDQGQKKQKPTTKFNFDQPLTIQKQVSSESKDLNMSFGRN